MLKNCRHIRATREVPYQAPSWGGEKHRPATVLAMAPTVSASALSAVVAALAFPGKQARGGAGQVLGAAAALIHRLTDPSARWIT